MKKTVYEFTGAEALQRRNQLEEAWVNRTPIWMRPAVSAILTMESGLAPSAEAETDSNLLGRLEVPLAMSTLFVGVLLVLSGTLPLALVGSFLLISGMRNLVSGVGHSLSHLSKDTSVRLVYDGLTGVLGLASWDEYARAHRQHHRHAAEEVDPDLVFLKNLGLRPKSWSDLVKVVLSLPFHLKFLHVRCRAVFLQGSAWRRTGAFLWNGWVIWHCSLFHIVIWYVTVWILYNAIAATAWITLHHWWTERSGSVHAKISAIEVTLGRLNLPQANARGAAEFFVSALVKALVFPGFGETCHDLHHGAWKGSLGSMCPHTRTQLILSGVALRQTLSAKGMFQAAFAASHSDLTDITGHSYERYLFM